MSIQEQLDSIKPGKNYPKSVKITEIVEGENTVIEFFLQSYVIGMYCAIHVNNAVSGQSGDHNNSTFIRKLKKDIKKAIERGATVEIGTITNITTI